jgi:hypothetical protein
MHGGSEIRTRIKRRRRPGSVGEAFRRAEGSFRSGERPAMKETTDASS